MNTQPLILAVGEILWDLLPAGKQLGGAPTNFAYHAAQLGARAVIVSAIGDDALGREVLDRVRALGLDTAHIATDPAHPTGTVTVSLDPAGQPSYTIHENVAWDFVPHTPALQELAAQADAVCFGTLAQRSPATRQTIRAVLAATRRDCLRILDINFRQHFYDRDVVDASLRHATVLKINDHELPELLRMLGLPSAGPSSPADLFARHPHLRWVALTRGAHGSVLYSRDGDASHHPGTPPGRVADTVGAGDSFTAALAVGLLRGLPLAEINARANRLASYVCTQPGATPPIPPEILAEVAGG